MFNSNKPTGFGTAFGSSFGTSTPFGSSTPSFGSTAFGSQTPASGGLFGATNPASSVGFGFGSTPSTSGGLFGQSTQSGSMFSTPNTFGQTNTAFGGFGNTGTGGLSLFGQNTVTTTSAGGTSIFGTPAFGSSIPNGTTIKFVPVPSTDSMIKSGIPTNINTKHQCLTAMKEYEQKSLEELRLDDYAANRKGKQQTSLFGSTPAGTTGGFGLFGQQQQQQNTFGSSGFGTQTPSTSLFGQTPASSGGLFGQSKPLFGTTTTSTSFGFGNTSTPSLFGQPQQKSLFGTATTTQSTGFFGSSGSTGFGNTSFSFGNTSTSTGNVFGAKPAGFGTSTTPSLFGSTTSSTSAIKPFQFGSNTSSSGFGNTTGSLFGKPTGFGTTSTGFGTGTNTFGSSGGFGSTFGTSGGFGFGSTGGTSLFGNQSKPSFNFGTSVPSFGGLGGSVGTTNTTFSFGNPTSTGMGSRPDAAASGQQALLQHQIQALIQLPYGDSPLFRNLHKTSVDRNEILKPTNPAAQKAALNQYKISPHQSSKLRPKLINPMMQNKKNSVFESDDDDDFAFSETMFVPRKSIKKLVLRTKMSNNDRPNPSITSMAQMNGDSFHNSSQIILNGSLEKPPPPFPNATYTVYNDSVLRPVTPLSNGNNVSADERDQKKDTDTSRGMDDTIMYYNSVADRSENANQSRDDTQSPLDFDKSVTPQVEPEAAPHPTGIVMTRPGYYTVPSLDELTSHMDANGDIYIENFTVGRYNYGSAFFPGITNVANINIDEIVHFRRKEVIIYPDDHNKPSLGEGLNRPAEVTLDCVWPMDKTTKLPIKSPERLQVLKYSDKIEKSTAKIGAKFIDYRPETGSWVFEVKHFSKYGLLDASDDEDESPPDEVMQQVQKQPMTIVSSSKTLNNNSLEKLYPTPVPVSGQISQADKADLSEVSYADQVGPIQVSQSVGSLSKPFYRVSDDKGSGEPMAADDDDEMMSNLMSNDPSQDDSIFEHDSMDIQDIDRETHPSSHRIATDFGVDPRNVQMMKATLFDDEPAPVDAGALRESRSDTSLFSPYTKSKSQQTSLFSSRFHHKHSPSAPIKYNTPSAPIKYNSPSAPIKYNSPSAPIKYSSSAFEFHQKPIDTKAQGMSVDHLVVPNGLRLEKQELSRLRITRPVRDVPDLKLSSFYKTSHLLHDAGLFMGRSFRVGWGPGNVFVHSGDCVSVSQPDEKKASGDATIFNSQSVSTPESIRSPWKVSIQKVNFAPYVESAAESIKEHNSSILKTQYKHCKRQKLSTSECPLFTPSIGVSCLHDLALLSDNKISGPDESTLEHMRMVWHLCVALWGNIPAFLHGEDVSDRIYTYQQARKEAVSDWLMMVTSKLIHEAHDSRDQDDQYLHRMLTLLSCGRVVDACTLAYKYRDYGLALLIAESSGSQFISPFLIKQLMNWADVEADKFIEPDRLKIYALLAGVPVAITSSGALNTCESFDWKRVFAIHLWFILKSSASISDVLNEYNDAYQGNSSQGRYSVPPLPPYIEESAQNLLPATDKVNETPVMDTCYHLLRLYTQRSYALEPLLSPTASTANQLDYRLCWHLNSILQSLGYTHLSETCLSILHTSYATQLETLGLWHWACFVLMHIEDPVRRTAAVRGVLNRYVSLSESPEYLVKEDFIRNDLALPANWIHFAKAQVARYYGYHDEEAWHLLKAEQWNRSHSVIMLHLAPEHVLDDDLDQLHSLLKELSHPERSASIRNWKFNGSVYLDFIELFAMVDNLTQESDAYDIEKMETSLYSLCSRLGTLQCPTAKHRLCQLEMAKKSANLARTLYTLQTEDNSSRRINLFEISENLPLSQDYTLVEIQTCLGMFRSSLYNV